jgi:hypothetical protein
MRKKIATSVVAAKALIRFSMRTKLLDVGFGIDCYYRNTVKATLVAANFNGSKQEGPQNAILLCRPTEYIGIRRNTKLAC